MHSLLPLYLILLSLSPPVPSQDVNPGGLLVSNDGSCGQGLTCAGSMYGQCCSQHGFCGTGDAYCGEGCQAEFGFCGSLASPSSSPPATSTTPSRSSGGVVQTVTLTRTVTAFASGLYTTTATVVGQVTRTVVASVTAVVSRTEVRTVTKTATITSAAALSTSIVYSVSYVTKNLTQVILETSTLTTIGACAPPTGTAVVPTTTAAGTPDVPSPTLVGSPPTCTTWYKVQSGENCNTVASKNGVSLVTLMLLNPVGQVGPIPVCGNDPASVVGLCRVNCNALWPGYYLCVGV